MMAVIYAFSVSKAILSSSLVCSLSLSLSISISISECIDRILAAIRSPAMKRIVFMFSQLSFLLVHLAALDYNHEPRRQYII